MILLIDNYDSFVHNLARHFARLGVEVVVRRNDAIDAAGVRRMKPRAVVISPGPCTPCESGCSVEVVRELHRELPILGVCLGHQAIVHAFGGRIVRAAAPVHGRASSIAHDGQGLFANIPNPLVVGRYHSLVAERATLPACLDVTASLDGGTIMAVRHREYPTVGVQFHPESILTESGYAMLANFCRISGIEAVEPTDGGADERPLPNAPRELPREPVTF